MDKLDISKLDIFRKKKRRSKKINPTDDEILEIESLVLAGANIFGTTTDDEGSMIINVPEGEFKVTKDNYLVLNDKALEFMIDVDMSSWRKLTKMKLDQIKNN